MQTDTDLPAPLVSVAVVTYNHVRFLGPCLDSVLLQETQFPFEIVVGDDASTDGTRDVVVRYATRYPGIIRPILHPHNLGFRANAWSVLVASRGEFIAYLDGDDLMLPEKLQRQVAYLRAHPEVALCFHNMRVFDGDTGLTIGSFNREGDPAVRTLDDLVRHGTVYCHSSKMLRRSALPAEGLDPCVAYMVDWLHHMQNARTGEVGFLGEMLGQYRKHRESMTASSAYAYERLLKDELYTLERAAGLGASSSAIAFGTARVWYLAAIRHLEAGRHSDFRHAIEQSAGYGVWVNRRHQLCYRLRALPSLLERLAKGYRRAVINRTLARERAWIDRDHGAGEQGQE